MGVADGMTGNGVLAADITNLRHDLDLQSAALARPLINKPCKYTTWGVSRKGYTQLLGIVLVGVGLGPVGLRPPPAPLRGTVTRLHEPAL
jgi:hypothetical protein